MSSKLLTSKFKGFFRLFNLLNEVNLCVVMHGFISHVTVIKHKWKFLPITNVCLI